MASPDNLVRWRNDFRQVQETIERGREEFEAWFEETAMLENLAEKRHDASLHIW